MELAGAAVRYISGRVEPTPPETPMFKNTITAVLAVAALASVGCSPSASSNAKNSPSEMDAANQDTGTCAMCNAQVPKDMLVEHDGKTVCEKCNAANHSQ